MEARSATTEKAAGCSSFTRKASTAAYLEALTAHERNRPWMNPSPESQGPAALHAAERRLQRKG